MKKDNEGQLTEDGYLIPDGVYKEEEISRISAMVQEFIAVAYTGNTGDIIVMLPTAPSG